MPSHDRERALVLAALAGVLEGSWAARGDLSTVDWPWVLGRLRAHALGARFWSEAQAACLQQEEGPGEATAAAPAGAPAPARLAAALPASVREQLEADSHETAAHDALLVHMALTAIAALDAAGVASMPIKGVALCLALPDFGAARAMNDVDLVVHPRDLARAARALAAVFPSKTEVRDYDGADRTAEEALRDGVENLYTYYSEHGAVLELHHAFPGLPSVGWVEGAFQRAHRLVHQGRSVLVPSLDDALGSACVHVLVHHGVGDAALLLRHVADVRALVASGASADRARALYDTQGSSAVARSARLLDEARQEARVPGASRSEAGLALDRGTAARLRSWASAVDGRVGRILRGFRRQGVRTVLPSRSFMVGLYGPDAAGVRLPLFHLRRWGAVLMRALRGRR